MEVGFTAAPAVTASGVRKREEPPAEERAALEGPGARAAGAPLSSCWRG